MTRIHLETGPGICGTRESRSGAAIRGKTREQWRRRFQRVETWPGLSSSEWRQQERPIVSQIWINDGIRLKGMSPVWFESGQESTRPPVGGSSMFNGLGQGLGLGRAGPKRLGLLTPYQNYWELGWGAGWVLRSP